MCAPPPHSENMKVAALPTKSLATNQFNNNRSCFSNNNQSGSSSNNNARSSSSNNNHNNNIHNNAKKQWLRRRLDQLRFMLQWTAVVFVCLQWYTAETTTTTTILLSSSTTSSSSSPSTPQQQQPQQQATNHTLVIVMGNLRGGERAWQTLKDHVLNVNQADLALMIGKQQVNHDKNESSKQRNSSNSSHSRSSSLYERCRYLWEFDEYDDWGDAIDIINGSQAWRQTVPQYLHPWSSILGGVQHYSAHWQGSGAIIFAIRWFLSQQIRAHNLTAKYDRFVITRSDHFYLCAHDVRDLDLQYLWLPVGQDNKGITDRHLVVSSEYVLEALDILPPLLQHPEDYAKLLARRSGNPEKLIRNVWQSKGLWGKIRRFDRVMFTCAESGDMTRWKQMSGYVVPEGVHLKYIQEYNASHETCDSRSQAA